MPENAMRMRDLHDHRIRSTSACPERELLDQHTPPGIVTAQQCCIRCSRVTARRDTDGEPWCGGEPVVPGDPAPLGGLAYPKAPGPPPQAVDR